MIIQFIYKNEVVNRKNAFSIIYIIGKCAANRVEFTLKPPSASLLASLKPRGEAGRQGRRIKRKIKLTELIIGGL